MAVFSVNVDTTALMRGLTEIEKRHVPAAMVSTLNRTAAYGKTIAVRRIAFAAGLPQKRVRDQVWISKASLGMLTAKISASGRHIKLGYFKASKTPKGVKARAWGTWKTYPGAFLATMPKTGHSGVFTRYEGYRPPTPKRPRRRKTWRRRPVPSMVRPRLHIRELYGPSIPREFERMIDVAYKNAVGIKLRDQFAHELDWRLKRAGLR